MKIGEPYIKVGRIKASIARVAHIKSADIYIDRNHIAHILKMHNKEVVESLGIAPFDYVKSIANNFNQIRRGTGDSLLLIVYIDNGSLHNTAAIELNYVAKQEFWEVRTAFPRRTSEVIKKERIW